jgi:hypothetical protein
MLARPDHFNPGLAKNWRKKQTRWFNKSVYNQMVLGFFLNLKPCEKYVGAAAR